MVIEQWRLGILKKQVRDELGFSNSPELDEEIKNKVNQAQRWIIRRRNNWAWLLKELSIDIGDDSSGVANFTRGSASVSYVSGTEPSTIRQVMVVTEATGDQTEGYLVTAYNTSTRIATLQSQYRGTTVSGQAYRLQTGYIQLPQDFIRFQQNADLDEISGDRLRYATPTVFEKLKRKQPSPGIGDRYYTVKSDPLGTDKRLYLCVFPYISSVTTIQGAYYFQPNDLLNDNDVSPIPASDRDVLFYAACWFMAQSKGKDSWQFYQAQAISQIEEMAKASELADDLDDTPARDPGQWINPPTGYPWWDSVQ